ncbi:AUXIN-RESPONSIVE PROTEIN [Salix purpurea]|uniref:AUXIN-RESPONSIVE PROTEIN n=1 Tax=Salix purpurea TaxID=77065 RepID=A0A9Q0VRX1_SALPP|nr:AUXIN-RESPONSIVE PROTEIN [Salix purpurea]
MTDLRISDLQENGTGAPFPPLANMTKLVTLILRSCNIIGRIPDFVGELTSLKTLDLSFNKLDGEIPDSFLGVKKAAYM